MGKYLDMWYGDSPRDADKIDIFFSDLDCIYRGNIYKNGRIIGDYSAKEAAQIEKMFPQLVFNWADPPAVMEGNKMKEKCIPGLRSREFTTTSEAEARKLYNEFCGKCPVKLEPPANSWTNEWRIKFF